MAIWDLEEFLTECPTTSGNLWNQLVRHCARGAVDQKFVTPVEQEIPKYIASLSEADKWEIWSQTETGQMNGAGPDHSTIEDIDVDLENELLAEVLEQAFRQAEDLRLNRSKRRTRRRT